MHTKGPNHCIPTATDRTSRDPYGHGSRSASPHLPRSLASMPNAWSNKVLAGVGGGSTASKTHEAKAELALGYFYSQLFFCIGRVTTKSPAAYPTCLPGQFIFQGLQLCLYLEAKASWHLWIERSSFSVHACVRARTRKMTEYLFESLAFSTRLFSTAAVCTSTRATARRARARLQNDRTITLSTTSSRGVSWKEQTLLLNGAARIGLSPHFCCDGDHHQPLNLVLQRLEGRAGLSGWPAPTGCCIRVDQ